MPETPQPRFLAGQVSRRGGKGLRSLKTQKETSALPHWVTGRHTRTEPSAEGALPHT